MEKWRAIPGGVRDIITNCPEKCSAEQHPPDSLNTEEEMGEMSTQSQDPSRISHKVFLRLKGPRESIMGEMNGRTTPNSQRVPKIWPAMLNDVRFAQIPRIFRTIVVKKKTPETFKSRICA